MKYNRSKLILVSIFVGSMLLNLVLAFSKRGYVWENNFTKLVTTILGVYSVHIAVVFTNIFFGQEKVKEVSSHIFWIAITLCVLWNMLLIIRMFSFAFAAQDDVKNVIEYLNIVALSGSFLIVGVLTYFFSKE